MTPNDPVVNKIETNIGSDEWLRVVPSELVNVVPESVWMTLSLESKKELMRQNGILEKYENASTNQIPQQAVELKVEQVPTTEVIVEAQQKVERSSEFAQAVEDLKQIDTQKEDKKDQESKAVLSKEEITRMQTEQSTSSNIKTYKFFGYQPSDNTYTNAGQISNSGPVDDSKTWAATLISKIFSLFE